MPSFVPALSFPRGMFRAFRRMLAAYRRTLPGIPFIAEVRGYGRPVSPLMLRERMLVEPCLRWMRVERRINCPACGGSGGGFAPMHCPRCSGSGSVQVVESRRALRRSDWKTTTSLSGWRRVRQPSPDGEMSTLTRHVDCAFASVGVPALSTEAWAASPTGYCYTSRHPGLGASFGAPPPGWGLLLSREDGYVFARWIPPAQ
jgi:hypothetical protein